MPELSKHAPTSVDGVGWPSGKGDLRTAASACRVAPIHAEACREVCHRLPKESRDTSHSIRIATLRLSAGTARTLGILIASTPFSLNTASICSVLCPLFALGEGVGASILHKDLHVVRPSPGSSRLISRVFRHCPSPLDVNQSATRSLNLRKGSYICGNQPTVCDLSTMSMPTLKHSAR